MPWDSLAVVAVFLVIMAPVYLLARLLVRVARAAYGFDDPEPDPEPPLRVCYGCNNTVMEDELSSCPYCGRPLPPRGWPAAPTDDPTAGDA